MKTVNFTEFRNNASLFLSAVEKGEIVLVMRHGKVIAKISLPELLENDQSSCKKTGITFYSKR